MNSIGLKYKSLFYSLSAHALLGLLLVLVYVKQEKAHEVHSLVKLSAIHFSSPVSQATPKPQVQTPMAQKARRAPSETVVQKREVPTPPVKAKAPAVKKVEPAKPLPIVEKKVENKEEKAVQKLVEPAETEQEPDTPELTVLDSAQTKSAPLVATPEPKLSYEAQYMEDNLALINALIKKNLSYPRLAKKRGLQGKTMVSFKLNKDGEVTAIEALGVAASILKKSAIKTIRRASSSFPHPHETLALQIPIVYKLN